MVSFAKDTPINPGRQALLGHHLMSLNDSRGNDSFGLVGIKDGKYEVFKRLGASEPYSDFITEFKTWFTHHRFSTHGAKTIANTHPFDMAHVLGVHNGVISNHSELNRKYKRSFEVDSMHIFAHMVEGLPLNDIQGYGTICWLNRLSSNQIHFCRLAGGEFSIYGIGTDGNDCTGIVGSSDEKHIIQAFSLAGINDYFEYKIQTGHVYFVENGVLYQAPERLALSEDNYKYYDWRNGIVSNSNKDDGSGASWPEDDHSFTVRRPWDDPIDSMENMEKLELEQEYMDDGYQIEVEDGVIEDDENSYGLDDDPDLLDHMSNEEKNWEKFMQRYESWSKDQKPMRKQNLG